MTAFNDHTQIYRKERATFYSWCSDLEDVPTLSHVPSSQVNSELCHSKQPDHSGGIRQLAEHKGNIQLARLSVHNNTSPPAKDSTNKNSDKGS